MTEAAVLPYQRMQWVERTLHPPPAYLQARRTDNIALLLVSLQQHDVVDDDVREDGNLEEEVHEAQSPVANAHIANCRGT